MACHGTNGSPITQSGLGTRHLRISKHAVYGFRAVEWIDDNRPADSDREKHKLRVRHAAMSKRGDIKMGWVVKESSVLPGAGVFIHDIESNLPCREMVTMSEVMMNVEFCYSRCALILIVYMTFN